MTEKKPVQYPMTSNEVLHQRITDLSEDVKDLKKDVHSAEEEMKDIRAMNAETNRQLSENLIRLTTLVEAQDRRTTEFEKRQENHALQNNERFTKMETKIDETFHKIEQGGVKWFQDFFDNTFGKTVKLLFIIILVLLGARIAGIEINVADLIQ